MNTLQLSRTKAIPGKTNFLTRKLSCLSLSLIIPILTHFSALQKKMPMMVRFKSQCTQLYNYENNHCHRKENFEIKKS